jgi:guanine deaminase
MILRCRVLSPRGSSEVYWLDDAKVEVTDGVITAVEPWSGGLADHDLRPAVVVPGFVDAHLHYPQTRIVGSASGPLLQWLQRSTFPEEERFEDPEHARDVAEIFVDRMLSAGTTLAMVYGSVHEVAANALFERLDASGMRALAGPVLMDAHSPSALTVDVDEAIPVLENLVTRWNGHDDGRLRVAVIPRFALSCTETMLAEAGRVARENDLWVTTHLSENLDECRVATERFGTADYLAIYENAGLLHERSVYAHCIHLSDSEWRRFAEAGAVVAHCPDSNDFLGSGGMPVGAVLDHAIPLAIGTDIAAGRSFRIPRILSSAYDNSLRQGRPLTPEHLFWLGTRGGALALGEDRVGAVEVGLRGDLVALDVPWWVETPEQALGAVLFDHDCRVLRTWVDGRSVFEAPT